MLWDDLSGQLIVIDLEYVKLLKRRRVLESTSGIPGMVIASGRGKAEKAPVQINCCLLMTAPMDRCRLR
jgi:hypothetical protein